MNDMAPAGRGIAMAFRSYALDPHTSLYDNMALGTKLAKECKPEIDAAVQNAAKILHRDAAPARSPKRHPGRGVRSAPV